MNKSPLFQRLAWVATALALVVIVAGAWVRLTDAGLGCPDWPGCYGMKTWPSHADDVERANAEWGHVRMVESGKAFREMFHRYLAGFLGLVILALAVLAWKNRKRPDQPVLLPTIILGLVVFQAALGMWTVTLLLKPAIVTAHLLGGMTTFALLLWLALSVTPRAHAPTLPARAQHVAVIIGLVVVSIQIVLGGWVSTNYAALACTGFPTCNGEWWPAADFAEGFRLWRGIGVDYEGGVLDQYARIAIQMMHRLWAVAALAGAIGLVLVAQLVIGVYNVTGGLPLANAVAHNGVAAIFLGTMVLLLDRTRRRASE